MYRILLVCGFYSHYAVQLCSEMQKRYPDLEFSILTEASHQNKYKEVLKLRGSGGIYSYKINWDKPIIIRELAFIKQIKCLPEFDIIHFLWIEIWFGKFAVMIKQKTKYLFLSVGGSDLYRDSKPAISRMFQKRLIKRANRLSAESAQTISDFFAVYGYNFKHIPMTVNRFGIDVFDEIDKKISPPQKNNVHSGDNRLKIACGHNAGDVHQHFAIIEQIDQLSEEVKEKCEFVFPMTYGEREEGYIDSVERELKNINVNYKILRDFMNTAQMADYVMDCDMMIHVQITDQLSSTMLSHMYCGQPVITGAWLPYEGLREAGVVFFPVDAISNLSEKMEEIVNRYEEYFHKCKVNREILHGMSSWDAVADEWYKAYIGE